jgi:ribonuclease D
MRYRLIATQPEVDQMIEQIAPEPEIALDTEADNMYHYRNRVCLLQIRWADEIVLIDTLVPGLELTPLFRLLETKRLLMHGSDFDLRLLSGLCDFRASEIFDTVLAAQLLGLEKIGLGSLIEHYFGVVLPKAHQKSDWSQRPLPEKMLDYAAQDVLYLFDLRDRMEESLRELGRLEWHRQRCDWQVAAGTTGFATRDENSWRVTGARYLRGIGLTVLHELWHWRDREAEKVDRPHFKVINDNFLLNISKAVQEKERDPLVSIPGSLRRRHGRGLVEAIRRGVELDPETLPRLPARERPVSFSPEELNRQELIKTTRDQVAAELKIDPSLIANRALLSTLARDPGKLDELLLPWQADLLRPCDCFEAGLGATSGR